MDEQFQMKIENLIKKFKYISLLIYRLNKKKKKHNYF